MGTAPRREQGEGAGALQDPRPSRALQQFWDTEGPAAMMAMDGMPELVLALQPRKQGPDTIRGACSMGTQCPVAPRGQGPPSQAGPPRMGGRDGEKQRGSNHTRNAKLLIYC